jgi:hypothetical protein
MKVPFEEPLISLHQVLEEEFAVLHGDLPRDYQMETETHDDCWKNYLDFRDNLANKVKQTLKAGQQPVAKTMMLNDRYAAAMCRIRYLRTPGAVGVLFFPSFQFGASN